MTDYINDMTGDELQRNLRDAYRTTTALNREIEMLNGLRVELQTANKTLQDELDDAYTDIYTMRQTEAKLRAQLAEAMAAIEEIAELSMSRVVNSQHMADERGRIAREFLAKHDTV